MQLIDLPDDLKAMALAASTSHTEPCLTTFNDGNNRMVSLSMYDSTNGLMLGGVRAIGTNDTVHDLAFDILNSILHQPTVSQN